MSNEEIRNQEFYFHYTPRKELSYAFIGAFAAAGIAHTYLGFKYNRRYLVWTAALCGYLEVVGWVGRLLGATNPDSTSMIPYVLNSLFTLFSPTFLLAGMFMLTRDLMQRLGACYSRLDPRLYGRVFVTCDAVSLFVQMSGGGLSAVKNENTSKIGGWVSLVGIIFQLVGLVIYIALGAEYLWRYFKDVPLMNKPAEMYYRAAFTKRVRWFTVSIVSMTFFILVRSVYRAVELAGGYDGKVASTQWAFVLFDGVMISQAIFTLVVLHPGWLLIESEEHNVAVTQPYMVEQNPASGPSSNSSYSLKALKSGSV
ncbi:RTA1-domain-containing protein [Peniophora sp. CONT]|nr:RTA1-domain-containing protein [Peniophora sp. CONT]